MEITPQEIQYWLEILAKPTAGLLVFIIIILYREAVIHLFKRIVDFVFRK